jgi:predicted O-methyltransferase YrrM
MAYFSEGDVLELGTHKGLSTAIIAGALEDSGSGGAVETIDIDAAANVDARKNVSSRRGADRVKFIVKDATKHLDELIAEQRQFGFIFVDTGTDIKRRLKRPNDCHLYSGFVALFYFMIFSI